MTVDPWLVAGIIGSVLFFGRFYVQWIISEWRGEYVVPISFWYMSIGGVLLMFVYAYGRVSPGGTFGLALNTLIYSRNIALVWREQGSATRGKLGVLWVLAGVITVGTVALTARTWFMGYERTYEFWVWTAVWVIGQGVFFLRFAVQWAVTEWRGKSTIPASFWWLSLLGMCLHGVYFLQRADWLLALGTFADGLPYARNLWLMRKTPSSS